MPYLHPCMDTVCFSLVWMKFFFTEYVRIMMVVIYTSTIPVKHFIGYIYNNVHLFHAPNRRIERC